MSVDLKDKYREETNKDVYSTDTVYGGNGSYSDDYVKWLEKQVKNNDLLHDVSESFNVGDKVVYNDRQEVEIFAYCEDEGYVEVFNGVEYFNVHLKYLSRI